jgi:CubicO group peptidase (beta-lactamase class C family)
LVDVKVSMVDLGGGTIRSMAITPTVDPKQVGLDPARLNTLDRHFSAYVDDGRLPGWQIVVTRRGEIAHASTYGLADMESGRPVRPDTLWRIYSMTKPVTSVAAMMLWEEGKFELTDEVSRYIPAFAEPRIYDKGSSQQPYTVPATEPIRIWHLLSHTAGLTYGFMYFSVVDALYRAAGHEYGPPPGTDLATACDTWARLPLQFQPGTRWGYSVATDVVGRLVEVISGQTLEEFFHERILGPLGMSDTRFWVDGTDVERLAQLYTPDPRTGQAVPLGRLSQAAVTKPTLFSGGAGLVSTATDYHRFTQMLLRGGELDGARLLAPRTIRLMASNHLPGGQDLAQLSVGGFAESVFDGVGFGLGFAVVQDPLPGKSGSSAGEFNWGGLASTTFWVDPSEELTAMFFTQLAPSGSYPIRPRLRQLVYAALVD